MDLKKDFWHTPLKSFDDAPTGSGHRIEYALLLY